MRKITPAIILACGLGVIYILSDMNSWFLFSRSFTLTHPSFTNKDNEGLFYAIDRAGRRVVIFNRDGVVQRCLYGGASGHFQFSRAAEVCADAKFIYIVNVVESLNGNGVEREEVLRLDATDKSAGVIYSRIYKGNDRPRFRGRISGIKTANGKVQFFYTHNDGVDMISVDPLSGAVATETLVSGKDQGLLIQSICKVDDGIIYLNRKGEIVSAKNGKRAETVYKATWGERGQGSFPCNLAVIEEDSIIFCDLEKKALVRIDGSDINEWITAADLEKLDIRTAQTVIVNSKVLDDGSALLIAGDSIVSRESGAYEIYGPDLSVGLPLLLKCYALWGASFLCVISSVMLLVSFYLASGRGLKIMLSISAGAALFIAAGIAVSAWFMQKSCSAAIEKEMAAGINTLMGLVPLQVNGDVLGGIKDPSGFMGDDYMKTREGMRLVLGCNNSGTGALLTGRITRIEGGWQYLVMDSEDSGTVNQPWDYSGEQGYPEDTISGKKKWESSRDMYGWHISGGAPVRDSSGKTVAWFEIHRSLDDYMESRHHVYFNACRITGVCILLILLINAVVYFFFMGQGRRQPDNVAGSGGVN